MKISHVSISKVKISILFLSFFITFSVKSQENDDDDVLFESYQNYTQLPRETSYAHLNKSTLVSGESLGFTVYLFDKYTKRSSVVTRNVYCTLETRSGKILKQQLILANNGVATGQFEIDDVFPTGHYVFKAYTNWMKNFEETNFYTQYIEINNPDDFSYEEEEDYYEIDAQFLPEGGHLVLDTKNTLGVVVKDDYGFGMSNLTGRLLDGNGNEITNFTTNAFGIATFEFTPESRRIYKVIFNDLDETTMTLDSGEPRGVTMSLADLNDKIAIAFRTNYLTLPGIKDQNFKMAISNGSQLNVSDVTFGDNSEIKLLISKLDLFTGINVITLFTEDNKPILERLFFKHDGINHVNTENSKIRRLKDSLEISFTAKSVDPNKLHNLSISVLPKGNKSYNHHHNILSSTYLKPYVKGKIENAKYYFTEVDRKKKLELDQLLVTQGWSSYNWNTIFNNPPNVQYEFEDGIAITANLNNTKGSKFLIYPQQNTPTITLDIAEGQKSFMTRGLLPTEDELFKIGVINKKNQVEKPNLYVQFSPSKIPELKQKYTVLKFKDQSSYKYSSRLPILDESWGRIEELGEVEVTAKRYENRVEKIERLNKGRVEFFNDAQRKNTTDFASYIATKGFRVFQDPRDPRSLLISLPRRTTFQDDLFQGRPLIYLNNLLVDQEDHRILMDIDMSTLDYVIIDKQGLGEGMRGANGVIKIFTNNDLRTREYEVSLEPGQEIEVPLSFQTTKQFYAPKYKDYKSEFFKAYGVIDWFGNCKIAEDGTFTLKIKDTKNDQIQLYIEGIANDGGFISEEHTITVNKPN